MQANHWIRDLGKWDAACLASLWALFSGACCWVSRDAEFPINDDWAYSLPVASVHEIGKGSVKHTAQGFVVTLAATLVRQLGVTIGIAFCFASALREGVSRRWMARALVPALLVIASLPVCRWLIATTVGLPGLYDARNAGVTATLLGMLKGQIPLRMFIDRGWLTCAVLALSLLPVVSLGLAGVRRAAFSKLHFVTLGLAALAVAALAKLALAFPQVGYVGHLFLGTGVGPSTLPGPAGFAISKGVQFAFNAAALGASLALLALLAFRISAARAEAGSPATLRTWLTPTQILGLVTALLSLGLMFIARGPYFDRHILAAVPMLLIVLAEGAKAPSRPLFVGVCSVLLGVLAWSTVATHDLFAWNRVRWQVGQELTHARFALSDLDAGFEFNNLAGNLRLLRQTGAFSVRTIKGYKCSYALQFGAEEGERVVESYPVASWLPSSPQAIVLIERKQPLAP